jgi:hypothetical protein
MRRVRIVAALVSVLSAGLFAAEAELQLDPKLAKGFTVRWSSVRYDRSVSVENPAITRNRTQKSESENLTLSFQAEIRDPNLILGVGREVVVTQVTDSQGRDVSVNSPPINSHDMYEGLEYTPQFSRPSPLPKWRVFIRTILRLPPPPVGPPQMVMELQPCRMTTRLDMGLLDQSGGEIRAVKGYFYAIIPGSTEQVEVPFEPNNAWVRLTPDVEIQVQEAVCENAFYRYRIETRPQGGGSGRPLMVGQGVPTRFVAAQQLIGEDGKLLNRGRGPGWLPVSVGGMGSGTGSGVGRIKAIRYVIAVGAKERKIPFELQHVPLPKP